MNIAHAFCRFVLSGLIAASVALGARAQDGDLLSRADSLLGAGAYAEAAGLYEQYLAAFDTSFQAQYGLARSYLGQDKLAAAVQRLDSLIMTHPEEADPRVLRGFAYLRMGRLDAAEADFRGIAMEHPEYGDAWYGLGLVFERRGRPRAAVASYSNWIEAAPAVAEAYLARARTLVRMGRRGEARRDLARARALGADQAAVEDVQALLISTKPAESVHVSVGYDLESLGGKWDTWHEYSALVQYDFGRRGALGGTFRQVDRYSEGDQAFRIDVYPRLHPRVSMHGQVQIAPDPSFLPGLDVYTELSLELEGAWVPSIHYRRMSFRALDAHFAGVGVEKYLERVYIRVRTMLVDVDGERAGAVVGHLRYYIREPATHLGIYLGYGREVLAVEAGPVAAAVRSVSGALEFQTSISDRVGIAAGPTYTHTDRLPSRGGVNLRLFARF